MISEPILFLLVVSLFVSGCAHCSPNSRMCILGGTLSLCDSPCSLMFFEAEEAPAHHHPACHSIERARDVILAASMDATQTVNP